MAIFYFSIYTVNFLVVLVFGGLYASDYPSGSTYFGVEIILAAIGVAIILEGQIIILERMILDIKMKNTALYFVSARNKRQ